MEPHRPVNIERYGEGQMARSNAAMTFLSFLISLLLVPAMATAAPLTDQTFALQNTSGKAATDLTVTFAQPLKGNGQPVGGAIIGSAHVLDASGSDTSNLLGTGVTGMPSNFVLKYPTNGNVMVPNNGYAKFTIRSAIPLQVQRGNNRQTINPNLTFFTPGMLKATEVDPSLVFNINPNGTATVLAGNGSGTEDSNGNLTSPGSYLFMTNIKIWTGLTQLNYDANGDLITSNLGTPNFTANNLMLAPGDENIPVDTFADPDPYDFLTLVLYTDSVGRDSNIADATPLGQFEFATEVPEPATLSLLASGLLGFAVALRHKKVR